MDITKLIDLAKYPATHDKDRYARTIRKEIRTTLEQDLDDMIVTVLHGALRLIDRRDFIEDNQSRLQAAINVIETLKKE